MATEIIISEITALDTVTEIIVSTGLNLIQYLVGLADYPEYTAGTAGQYLKVNSTENGVEWADSNATTFNDKPSGDYLFGDDTHGTVNWSTNADNIVKSGFYFVTTDKVGLPTTQNCYLLHQNISSTNALYSKQTLTDAVSGEDYIRTRDNGAWGAWKLVPSEERVVYGDDEHATISWPNGVNNINKSGFYYVYSDYTDLPINGSGYVIHANHFSTNGYGTQTFTANGTDNFPTYKRQGFNNVWQPWEEIVSGIEQFAMTKAQFDANSEQRKREYAGSGFAEWGKHVTNNANANSINEGMYSVTNASDNLWLGNDVGVGLSRTNYPVTVVDGVEINLDFVGTAATQGRNKVLFAPAPDGTKTYDSATGVVTTHATSNEAFEGVVTNGDFRNGTNDWVGRSSTLTASGGVLTVTGDSTTVNHTGDSVTFNVVTGVTYRLSFIIASVSASGATGIIVAGADINNTGLGYYYPNTVGLHTVTMTFASPQIALVRLHSGTAANATASFSNVEFMPATESVITDRKDLVFLETWHEAISDKDIVVPFGNVQYGSTTYEGITSLVALTTIDVGAGYSKFGEWQLDANSIGYGKKWSTQTDLVKKVFIEDPRNNIYYDSETDELIQVRYRIRSVEGLGNNWNNLKTNIENDYLRYSPLPDNYVALQGKVEISKDYAATNEPYITTYKGTAAPFQNNVGSDVGIFVGDGRYTERGVDRKCFAVPIALVQRLNQGAYHPALNSTGCRQWRDETGGSGLLDGSAFWYDITDARCIPNSTADAFNIQPTGVPAQPAASSTSGYIGSPVGTGRSDQYDYYDAVYAAEVEDLRLSANKQDTNKLLEDSIRKSVAGTMRGKGKVPFTNFASVNVISVGLSGSTTSIELGITYSGISYNISYIVASNGNIHKIVNSGSGNYFVEGDVRSQFAIGSTTGLVVGTYELSSEFDSLPYVNIIGDPVRIAATFPNGCVGEWLPVIPDGSTVTLEEMFYTKKCITTNVVRNRTDDDGASWTQLTTVSDQIRNRMDADSVLPVTRVELWHYESLSDFTESAVNSKVVGQVGDVDVTSSNSVIRGNRLHPSLTGNIGKTSGSSTVKHLETVLTTKFVIGGDSILLPNSSESVHDVEHIPLGINTQNNSPAVKALYTLTEKDGLLYAQFHGSELVYDSVSAVPTKIQETQSFTVSDIGNVYWITNGSFDRYQVRLVDITTSSPLSDSNWVKGNGGHIWRSTSDGTAATLSFVRINRESVGWGDNTQIPIINNEGTQEDLNGNTVKTFCHHLQIPIGIADSTSSSQSTFVTTDVDLNFGLEPDDGLNVSDSADIDFGLEPDDGSKVIN